MLPDLYINRYCRISDNRITVNGQKIMDGKAGTELRPFLSSAYKGLNLDYPKFYKMDLLSKLGFLTTEFLIQSGEFLKPYETDRIAIVASNSESSLETDNNYIKTIADPDNYYPNPGLFVYTLPNLLIGEICIRHGIKGESTFFISKRPDFATLHTYCTWLMRHTNTQAAITGWVDLDPSHHYESILFFVEKQHQPHGQTESWPFTADAMDDLCHHNLEDQG